MRLASIVFIIAGLLMSGQLLASPFTVIQLKHHTAADLLPTLAPMIEAPSSVTGSGYKLIIKATPEQLPQLRKLIDLLDTPLQQLIISVSQEQNLKIDRQSSRFSADIQNKHNQININKAPPQPGLTVGLKDNENQLAYNRQSDHQDSQRNITQTIRVLSGQPALIQTGQLVPLPQHQVVRQHDRVSVIQSTDYHQANSGFYVIPRINGERVSLHIKTQQHQVMRPGIHAKESRSQVQGNVGEWIKLGSVNELTQQQQKAYLSDFEQTIDDQHRIYIKVEVDQSRNMPSKQQLK